MYDVMYDRNIHTQDESTSHSEFLNILSCPNTAHKACTMPSPTVTMKPSAGIQPLKNQLNIQ